MSHEGACFALVGACARPQALTWREALAATRNPADVAGRLLTFVWVGMLSNFLVYGGTDAVSGEDAARLVPCAVTQAGRPSPKRPRRAGAAAAVGLQGDTAASIRIRMVWLYMALFFFMVRRCPLPPARVAAAGDSKCSRLEEESRFATHEQVMPFLFMSVFTADKRFYIADVASR